VFTCLRVELRGLHVFDFTEGLGERNFGIL
jgi:hypothetical protein